MSKPCLYSLIALVVALFWLVGACTRLSRLRAQVGLAFRPLQEQWQRQLALGRQLARVLALAPGPSPETLRLLAAVTQFERAAASLQARPTQAECSDMLVLARTTLHQGWCQAVCLLSDAQQAVDTPEVPTLSLEAGLDAVQNLSAAGHHDFESAWDMLRHQEMLPLHAFNSALQAYNQAVTQFPAVLLARVLLQRPGRLLGIRERTA